MNASNEISDILAEGFGDKRILVVGDVMLDRYLCGQAERISPEAPIPVVHVQNDDDTLGGAGNVARNLACLGAQVELAGFLGCDNYELHIRKLLQQDGIGYTSLVSTQGFPTIVKTRVVSNHQQMLRIDHETVTNCSEDEEMYLLDALPSFNKLDAVILSDYAKGTLCERVCREIIRMSQANNVPVLVDPKGTDYTKYSGATAVTPNKKELASVGNIEQASTENLCHFATELADKHNFDHIFLTLGEEGIAVINNGVTTIDPALGREVFDVSGAGDTVISTLTLGLISGVNPETAAHLGNIAADIVIGQIGTAPVHITKLRQEYRRLYTDIHSFEQDEILPLIEEWRNTGNRIVFTNGCFDLLHIGHIKLLDYAKEQGDKLIVALNTDDSVNKQKGGVRPIIPQDERAKVLSSLESVDAVVFFDEDTPYSLIKSVKPDVLVKGDEYTEDQIVGADFVKEKGGIIVRTPTIKNTTDIINRIRGEE